MKMQEVREIARKWEIPFRIGLTKEYLIHEIQKKEGYEPCFRSKSDCPEACCLWMDDCIGT